jgi:surface antigen
MKLSRTLARRCSLALLVALPCMAIAAPPDWAPAHGWRKKNAAYTGYSGRSWDDDYGVRSGSCNRDNVGAVLGGIAGGVVGAEVGKGTEQRGVAIVLGTVIGAAIGAEIGRRMDKTDRSCVGHSLELVGAGQSVKWTNPNTRVTYQLTPVAEQPRPDGCRSFRLIAHGKFGLSEGRTMACPDGAGVWSPARNLQVDRR